MAVGARVSDGGVTGINIWNISTPLHQTWTTEECHPAFVFSLSLSIPVSLCSYCCSKCCVKLSLPMSFLFLLIFHLFFYFKLSHIYQQLVGDNPRQTLFGPGNTLLYIVPVHRVLYHAPGPSKPPRLWSDLCVYYAATKCDCMFMMMNSAHPLTPVSPTSWSNLAPLDSVIWAAHVLRLMSSFWP